MTQQLPSGFTVIDELPEGFSVVEEEEQKPSFMEKAGDFFTGNLRTDRDIERTPSLMESPGFFSDAPLGQVAKVSQLLALTNDPNEMADIITASIPGTRVQYNKDAQGNVYPLIVNSRGESAIIDKPGIDLLNIGQFAGQAAAFTPAGRATSVTGAAAKEMATQAAIEAAQQTSGGEFNSGDVLLAGAIGGGGKALEKGAGALYRGLKGAPTEQADSLIKSGKEFDVPVMTTDVLPPQTKPGKFAQSMAETIPIVGTGGERAIQQQARETATDKFIEQYQGGTYTQVIQGLKDKKDIVKKAAGKTYENINPKLSKIGPIGFDKTENSINNAMDLFSAPGRKTDPKAIELLTDIQETIGGEGQVFQTVKDNIGAWTNKIDSIDSGMTSKKDMAELKKVLSSMRRDRDDFARQNLSNNDFRRLKRADSVYGDMADELKRTKTKGLLDKGDVTPEIAKQSLFSTNKSDIDRLYKDLSTEGKNNARSVIIQEITDKLNKRVGGLTPNSLATELGKHSKTLETFFRGPERRQLQGYLRLMEHTRRAQDAGVTTVSGQQTIPYIAALSGYIDPTIPITYGSVGAFGRVYETPKVRSLVSRMASIEPGSTEFERLANLLQQTIQASAQASKGNEE